MADHTPIGPVETGAQMDYEEHLTTYSLFVSLVKYGTLICLCLLISMSFGFFVAGSIFPALILFVILCAGGVWLLRGVPAHIT